MPDPNAEYDNDLGPAIMEVHAFRPASKFLVWAVILFLSPVVLLPLGVPASTSNTPTDMTALYAALGISASALVTIALLLWKGVFRRRFTGIHFHEFGLRYPTVQGPPRSVAYPDLRHIEITKVGRVQAVFMQGPSAIVPAFRIRYLVHLKEPQILIAKVPLHGAKAESVHTAVQRHLSASVAFWD